MIKIEGEHFSLEELAEGYGDLKYRLHFSTFGLGCEIWLDEERVTDLLSHIKEYHNEQLEA